MKTNQSLFSPHFQASREKAGDNENTMTMPAFRVGKSFFTRTLASTFKGCDDSGATNIHRVGK